MAGTATNHVGGDQTSAVIVSTLFDALAQSQALVKELEEQSIIVDQLKEENRRLQQELQLLRAVKSTIPANEEISAQLDQLFRKDAESQAEVEQLKNELLSLREEKGKERLRYRQIPSPPILSEEVVVPSSSQPRSPPWPGSLIDSNVPREKLVSSQLPNIRGQPDASPSKKRLRASSSERIPLQQLSNHHRAGRNGLASVRDEANRGAEAIGIITEDGEGHDRGEGVRSVQHKQSLSRDGGAMGRLDALLMTPAFGTTSLPCTESRSRKSASPASERATARPSRRTSDHLGRYAPPQNRPKDKLLPPRRRLLAGPEDEEPLRSRPLSRLNLSHFKLNPIVNNWSHFTHEEALRRKEKVDVCWDARDQGPDINVSDDHMLIYSLGHESEDKIRASTKVAREKLLHEARIKRSGDVFGEPQCVHHRGESPTGFWDVDMPVSQEAKSNRGESKQRERNEVEKRYREASKDGGRWVFADE